MRDIHGPQLKDAIVAQLECGMAKWDLFPSGFSDDN
ncbi:hypothetical protein V475_20895 [Sphingobium baderi LL03]|uniref:Uncharacterized protein n=1 Tax=Sphingobium baderi LL03 TaxID=1114964 RepID=T0HS73_9SPHN|nr:hypothetical protein L485_09225 [Sphingobium baderi LL03]KMS59068.1 hypothetical protein V475_20895 [Sphingobium baderi LL03]